MHGHWLLEPQFHLDVIIGDEFEVFTYLMPVKLPMDWKVYSRSWKTWAPLVTVSKAARPDEVSMVTLSVGRQVSLIRAICAIAVTIAT